MSSSAARRVLDPHERFQSLTLKQIESMPSFDIEETLHFDCKLISTADFSKLDDKQNLAKSTSGFANSEGGFILWGVNARKDTATGIDRVIATPGIPNVRLALSRLVELSGSSVDPLIQGIEHRIVVRSDRSGFALTFVPESDSGPHMAKLGLNRYYKRNGQVSSPWSISTSRTCSADGNGRGYRLPGVPNLQMPEKQFT